MTSSMYLRQFLSPFASTPAGELLGLRLAFRLGGAILIGLGLVFVVYSSMAGTAFGKFRGIELAVEEGSTSDNDDA